MYWLKAPLSELEWEDLPLPVDRSIVTLALREIAREDYREYLNTIHWRTVRARTIEYAQGRCFLCFRTGLLHVHYIRYDNIGCEPPEDLVALCPKHHKRQHEVLNHVRNSRLT